jgi:hypothetical protein
MNKIHEWVNTAGILLVVILVLVGGNQSVPTGEFGASGSRFPNGISADTTSPSAGEVRGSTLTITGSSNLNGLDTKVSAGSLVGNTTTTVLSLANPYSATSTVDLVRLTQTAAATTTFSYNCGTSTTATTLPGGSIIVSGSVATGTLPGIIENGITTGLGAYVSGGSVAKIMVGPAEYLNCVVAGTYSTYWTTTTNAFAGTYKVQWNR